MGTGIAVSTNFSAESVETGSEHACCSGRPARARAFSPCNSSPRRSAGAARPRCSFSTRSLTCSSTGQAAGLRSRRPAWQAGACKSIQLDAAELSPGEFAYKVRSAAQDPDVKTVVIDSLNGISGGDAPGEFAHSPHARAAAIPQSPGCFDLPDRRPARPDGRDEARRST